MNCGVAMQWNITQQGKGTSGTQVHTAARVTLRIVMLSKRKPKQNKHVVQMRLIHMLSTVF